MEEHKMQPRFLGAFLAAMVLVATICATAAPAMSAILAEDYEVSSGIFRKSTSGLDEIVPATNLPLRFEESGFSWGFIVRNRKGASFVGHEIIRMPKAPASIGFRDSDVTNNGTVVVRKPEPHKGVWSSSYNFEPGDPLGAWTIEIYIDNHLLKSINFTVVPDK